VQPHRLHCGGILAFPKPALPPGIRGRNVSYDIRRALDAAGTAALSRDRLQGRGGGTASALLSMRQSGPETRTLSVRRMYPRRRKSVRAGVRARARAAIRRSLWLPPPTRQVALPACRRSRPHSCRPDRRHPNRWWS